MLPSVKKFFKKTKFRNGYLLYYSLATVGLVAIMHVISNPHTIGYAEFADAMVAKYETSGHHERILKTRFQRDILTQKPNIDGSGTLEIANYSTESTADSFSEFIDSINGTSITSDVNAGSSTENSSFTELVIEPSSMISNVVVSNESETLAMETNNGSINSSVEENSNSTDNTTLETSSESITTSTSTTTTTTETTITRDPCEGIVNAPSSLFFPPYHLKPYQIRARWSKINSPVPLRFSVSYYHMSSLMGYGITENYTYNILNLMPCKEYTVCVVALFEGCGQSDVKCNNVTTATSLADSIVQNLTAICSVNEAYIQFGRPITNCPINHYNLTIILKNGTSRPITHWVNSSNETINYKVQELKPYTQYNFTVWAENMTYLSQHSYTTCRTRSSKPSKVRNESIICSDTSNIICNWVSPEIQNGESEGYDIIIYRCPKGQNNSCMEKPTAIHLKGTKYNFTGQPGTLYKCEIQARTKTVGPGEKVETSCVTQDDSTEITLLVIAAFLIIILLIIILSFVLLVLQRKNIIKIPCCHSAFGLSGCQTQTSSLMSIPFRATSKPVRLVEFEEHYRSMSADSSFKFSQEFEELNFVSPQWPTTVAQTSENRPKNRWINILPFDHSRVKLLPIADDIFTDYINASYIPGYRSQREFIASQGPLPNTKDDFWRMIWEQNSPMIVMVTQCTERGKVKCEQYWPEDRETHYYGDLAVTLKSESILTGYTLRIFDLQLKMPIISSPTAIDLSDLLELIPRIPDIEKGSRTMEVKQMHFTMWPDFGSPENTSLLLNFVGSVRDHMPHESTGPIVVHCSAGVGRTGTFIAVDKLMQHIEDHDSVDIYGTVREMRNYRTNMVQSEDQYMYIHECIKDLLADMQTRKSVYKDNGESIVDILGMAQTNLPPDVIEPIVTETTELLSVMTATSALTADTVVSDINDETSLLSEHRVSGSGPVVHTEIIDTDTSGNNMLCLTNTNSTLHAINDSACNPSPETTPEIHFGLTTAQNERRDSDVWFF